MSVRNVQQLALGQEENSFTELWVGPGAVSPLTIGSERCTGQGDVRRYAPTTRYAPCLELGSITDVGEKLASPEHCGGWSVTCREDDKVQLLQQALIM